MQKQQLMPKTSSPTPAPRPLLLPFPQPSKLPIQFQLQENTTRSLYEGNLENYEPHWNQQSTPFHQ